VILLASDPARNADSRLLHALEEEQAFNPRYMPIQQEIADPIIPRKASSFLIVPRPSAVGSVDRSKKSTDTFIITDCNQTPMAVGAQNLRDDPWISGVSCFCSCNQEA
jgi:hypothetical protein